MKKAILVVALIGIATSCFAGEQMQQMEVSSEPEDSLLQEAAPTRWSRFKKRLQYYAPSAQTKIVAATVGFLLCVSGSVWATLRYGLPHRSEPGFPDSPPPCPQVPWNRLNAPCDNVNFSSTHAVETCQYYQMRDRYPYNCVPICNENDSHPWVPEGEEFINASECAHEQNMTGNNNFLVCNWGYLEVILLDRLLNRSVPFCRYGLSQGDGLLISHEYLSEAVNFTDYEEVAKAPSLISESSYCREAVTAAGSFEGCTGPIVQNNTAFNSSHSLHSNQKKRTKKKAQKRKKR